MNVNVVFTRSLLSMAHKTIKEYYPEINLKEAWVWCAGRNHWEFHGPDKFYWHGSAGTAYEARYNGWMAWLESKGIHLDDEFYP